MPYKRLGMMHRLLVGCLLASSLVAPGCACWRCGPLSCSVARPASSGAEPSEAEVELPDESWQEPEVERPVSRFHPVPAWDVFHPPSELSYEDPVAAPRCQPFYLPPPRAENVGH